MQGLTFIQDSLFLIFKNLLRQPHFSGGQNGSACYFSNNAGSGSSLI
jgi:hypothetical protein